MQVEILDITTDSLFNISMAARTCYNSRNKYDLEKRDDFIRGLIKSGHETPLEFADIIFDIRDISRSCSHQLVRHRIASYCQMSQRYVNQETNNYVIPHTLDYNKNNDEKSIIFENAIQNCRQAYKELLALGVPKEDARYVLPEAMFTNITVKFNFRSLRNFLKLRLDSHAQWEIRELANKIKDLIIEKGLKVLIEDLIKN